MRTDFISRLALMLVAGFLVVATQVWMGSTLAWLFIGGGVAMILLAAVDWSHVTELNGVIAILGIWSIVQAIVFSGDTREWVSLITALAGVTAGVVGLSAHEAKLERRKFMPGTRA